MTPHPTPADPAPAAPAPASPELPRWARSLGLAGLIPFVLGAIALWTLEGLAQATAGWSLLAYAATIAAFLGGIHWGAAMRSGADARVAFAWGVVPQLVGWLALLLPLKIGLVAVAALLLLCYGVDRRLYPQVGLAAWLPMRRGLTLGAALCCGIAAVAVFAAPA